MANPDDDSCFSLTYGERIIGFGICAGCALLSGILSIVSLFILNLRKFSVLFTVSTILFMISLSLLIGCKRICSVCTDKNRLICSGVMILGITMTLFFGVYKRVMILSIAGFIVEFLSFIYFALSFIPGGERLFHYLFF